MSNKCKILHGNRRSRVAYWALKKSRQTGFTLIEIVIAMTLAAMATLLGAAVLKTGMDYYERTRAYLHEQEEIRSAIRAVDAMWSQRITAMFDGKENSVLFMLRHPARGPNYEWVWFARFACIERDDGRFSLVEEYYDRPERDDKGRTKGSPAFLSEELLVDGLYECRFSYLIADEKKKQAHWVDRWTFNEKDRKPAPRLLRLHISLLRGVLPPLIFSTEN